MLFLGLGYALLALQGAATTTVGPGGLGRSDTAVAIRRVVAAETRFLRQWDSVWRASEGERHSLEYDRTGAVAPPGASALIHCHTRDPYWSGVKNRFYANGIESRRNAFAICPSWYTEPTFGEMPDERVRLDVALTTKRIGPIVAARESLIQQLDSAVRSAPRNDWLIGQLIRFLVDQGQESRALDAARQCAASRWWCAALTGFVLARRSAVPEADSAFRAASDALSQDARCEWTDARVLLDSVPRRGYAKLSCAQRDSLNARLWWLSDPLFIEPGNARRVEHYTRKVLGLLHSALDRDERYDWSDTLGGDARREMILRYGWPTRVFWMGGVTDTAHGSYVNAHYYPFDPPYTTYEYTPARQHLVPAWHALSNPFSAVGSDWVINEPPPPPKPDLPPALIRSWLWWPVEHYAPAAPLAQLPQGQVALLRRQDNVLLAVAVDLVPKDLGRRLTESVRVATLVVSEQPDSIRRVATGSGVVGASMVLTGLIDARPAVAGVEYTPTDAPRPGGRSRFGITPPATLATMKPGELAISDPVLLQAPSADEVLPSLPDSALKRMAGATRVQNVGRLGVYWETYGFKPSDSLEVAVWIERYTPQGFLRRFAKRLNLAEDLNTPVAITWQEAQAGRNAYAFAGPVPIIARTVTLDVSKLAKGDYWLDIVVRKPGQEPVRGRRSFAIE